MKQIVCSCLCLLLLYSTTAISQISHSSYQRIAVGYNHTLQIRNGTLWVWGSNGFGQLGIGNTTGVNTPLQAGMDTNWVSVTAGQYHSLGLKSDGTLWAWGYNNYGQLGNSSTSNATTPQQIGTDAKWVSVAAGGGHTLALKSDGTLWAWGWNSNGQLGIGNTTNAYTPQQVGTDNKWVSVIGGGNHNLALKSDGTLWAWGDNQIVPRQVQQAGTTIAGKWVSVKAGGSHSLALKSDSTLWFWGNTLRTPGYPSVGVTIPQQVGGNWASIAAGGYHDLALRSDSTLYVASTATGNQNWGGELGMEFTVNQASGIVVKQLGAFDHQGNGITGTQSGGIRVAVFNKVTQSIVPGLDAIITGNADHYTGNHRMKDITPVTLMPGDYVIVSKGYNANELNGNSLLAGAPYPFGDSGNGAISFKGTGLYGTQNLSTFSYPLNADVNNYLAGTFVYDVLGTNTGGLGNNTVLISVKDAKGNIGYATATVTVQDVNGVCNQQNVSIATKTAVPPAVAGVPAMRMQEVKVYPNPSSGVFNVVLSRFNGAKVSLEVTDGNGKVVAVKSLTLSSQTPVLTIPFDLGSKASGIYWIKAVSATGVQTAKLLIQR